MIVRTVTTQSELDAALADPDAPQAGQRPAGRAARDAAGRAVQRGGTVSAPVQVTAILDGLGSRYVEALNAVLASRNDSPDVDRWRGQAEAYRQAATLVRKSFGADPVDMTSAVWRKANGVYQPDYLATLFSEVAR